MRTGRPLAVLLIVAAALAAAGCEPVAEFRSNRLYVGQRMGRELAGRGSDDPREASAIRAGRQEQLRTIDDALVAMFGTPDEPLIIDDPAVGIGQVIDAGLLRMAAGKVGTDEHGFPRGLYRQHCVHCHGVSGDGRGPTAEFLNPYPRDFRPGIYKFKSTPLGERPTDDDLRKTLIDGIPGTAMPSFKLLASDELSALVNYVKYLSIRGEAERAMVDEAVLNVAPDDPFDTSRDVLMTQILEEIVQRWARAGESVTPVPSPERSAAGEELAASVDLGRRLFNARANCFACHGVSALGDGQTDDFDAWAKDFADWKNLPAAERQRTLTEYRALGGLGPRNALPRNLRHGVFRGGRRPVDLYWRIRNGIEGTPMPAAETLTEAEIWSLVDYVQQLPYESMSQPPGRVVENLRINP